MNFVILQIDECSFEFLLCVLILILFKMLRYLKSNDENAVTQFELNNSAITKEK